MDGPEIEPELPEDHATSPEKMKRKLNCPSTDEDHNEDSNVSNKKARTDSSDSSFDVEINAEDKEPEIPESDLPWDFAHPVFSTDVVMTEILSNLSCRELLICREVSKSFNSYCSQTLRSRRSLKYEFKYDWTVKSYISTAFKGTEGQLKNNFKLDNFTQFLQTSQDLSYTSFSFKNGTLKDTTLQTFFQLHGENINDLELDIFCPPTINESPEGVPIDDIPRIESLISLLMQLVPNVNILRLNKPPAQWNSNTWPVFSVDNLFKSPKKQNKQMGIYLDKLKSLELGNSLPEGFTEDLLKGAINLKEISACPNPLPVLKANKFHLLQYLQWIPYSSHINIFEQLLLDKKNQFEKLQLLNFFITLIEIPFNPQLWSRLSKIINYILTQSSSTLMAFNLGTSLGFLENDLRIPQLPNLKTLNIGIGRQPDFFINQDQIPPLPPANVGAGFVTKRCFPAGFQLSSTFPFLTAVTLSIAMVTEFENWENYFDHCEPVQTVRYVSWGRTRFFPRGWVRNLAQLFPNVEVMEVNARFFNVLDAATSGLWTFQKLKDLTFYVNLNIPQNCFPSLDSAFTGFSEATCLNLQDSEEVLDSSALENLRENDSIINLKELEFLWMSFTDDDPVAKINYPRIISRVATTHAFKTCPNLKIACGYSAANVENKEKLKIALNPFLETNN